jgi:hypothetical protein
VVLIATVGNLICTAPPELIELIAAFNCAAAPAGRPADANDANDSLPLFKSSNPFVNDPAAPVIAFNAPEDASGLIDVKLDIPFVIDVA